MSDLAAFVLARLDEDEVAARAAEPAPWKAQVLFQDEGYVEGPDGGTLVYNEGTISVGTADHIARHDPARVLADVAAKRAIVELHRHFDFHWIAHIDDYGDARCDHCHEDWPCPTLRLLALPWQDHPDYDPAWKVEA